MVGRFLRAFPGHGVEAVLDMPVQRFWALYLTIPALEAADDLRALMVAGHGANVGKEGQNFARMSNALRAQADGKPAVAARQAAGRPIVPGLTPGVAGVEAGSLKAERMAKLAALKAAGRDA